LQIDVAESLNKEGGEFELKLNGAQILIECLREQGVDTIFGYPGGTVLPIYDALYDAKDIMHVTTAHEQGATHAADGYARATGRTGVVLATSGPGATNTITGIATAYRDSVPIVVFTGQVPLKLIGKASFQEVDIVDITNSITKCNYLIKKVGMLAETIREAFSIARSGRPGPVLVDIPKDIQSAEIEFEKKQMDITYKNEPEKLTQKDNYKFKEAVYALNNCKKPLIFAGGGVSISGASTQLLKFAEQLKAPVSCSLMGIGSFPEDNALFTGMLGMHGSHCSNYAASECDLLIAVGVRFSDRVISCKESFAPYAKVIHIDIDPAEIGKNVDVQLPLCGDVKCILEHLNTNINKRDYSEWNAQIDKWKSSYKAANKERNCLSPKLILETLCTLSKGKSIITTEVGQNQIWTAQYFTFNEPRMFLSSGGLGTMGYGLSAAIGAAFGKPDKRIVNIAGDGSFKMNSIELATIAKYNLPIVQIVFNNHALGMVRQWQSLFYNERFSATDVGPDVDFVKLAQAYGIKAVKVTLNAKVKEVLELALSLNEPFLIECEINSDDKVSPIVPPGAPISEFINCAAS